MPLSGFASIDPCAVPTPAGAGTLEYAAVDGIDAGAWEAAVKASTWNQQKAIQFSTGEWFALPYVTGTGRWREEQQDNEQGAYFRLNIEAFTPIESPEARGEFNAMKQHRYVLRITKGGKVYLIGSPERPLRFSSNFDSGAEGGDQRGHRIVFEGVSLKKVPAYVPVF